MTSSDKRAIMSAYRKLSDKLNTGHTLSGAEQWFYDNAVPMTQPLIFSRKIRTRLQAKDWCIPSGAQLCEDTLIAAAREQQIVFSYEETVCLPLFLAQTFSLRLSALAQGISEASEDLVKDAVLGFHAALKLDTEQLLLALCPAMQALLDDETFAHSDFETQLLYLNAVSKLAQASGFLEDHVVRKASPLVGENLLGEKRLAFKKALGLPARPPISPRLYIALLLACAYGASFFLYFYTDNVFFVFLTRFLFLGLFTSLFSRLLLWRRSACILPRLRLSDGIPAEGRTLVVFPVFMGTTADADELLAGLAQAACANPDDNLLFALLVDFKDAQDREDAADHALIEKLTEGLVPLSERYGDKFICLIRHREPAEDGIFRPKERKRGALCALNRLLLFRETAPFRYISHPDALHDIRFVLTLDRDTVLPPGTAKKLVATMLHPLNRPHVQNGIVTKGYGVIQPRVMMDFSQARRTLFSCIFSGGSGLDPYACAGSDFYQTVFEEGIYTGKGIYDPRVFEDVLNGAVPENRVLSHDLLEGSYTRCGLASDIVLLDGCPSSLLPYTVRQHRWIRGDWQLLPWLMRRVRRLGGSGKNPLTVLSRWKIFDNLRRSLMEPAAFLLCLAGFWSKEGMLFLYFALISLFLPVLVRLYHSIGYRLTLPVRALSARFSSPAPDSFWGTFLHALMRLCFLPYTAYMATDAIVRTLYRLIITKKNLLQWVTAADSSRQSCPSLVHWCRKMWPCPLFGALTLLFSPHGGYFAYIIGLLWLLAPVFAYTSAKPLARKETLTDAEKDDLLRYAARTWRWFDEEVTETTHYLPPDNVQESPPVGTAMRTSPTNIGFYLLALLYARRLGLIGENDFLCRTEKTLDTLMLLDKKHGHLYNWYDLTDLSPLSPPFISTVDSGNLAACLQVLKEGLLDAGSTDPREGLRALLRSEDPDFVFPDALSFEESLSRIATTAHSPRTHRYLKSFQIKHAPSVDSLVQKCTALLDAMDFRVLYDPKQKLFAVGLDAQTEKRSDSFYDTLASEARLTYYIAIAKGVIPMKSWFTLRRPITLLGHRFGLASWSGTAFEYWLPALFLEEPKGSMLHDAALFCLSANRRYAKENTLPFWGTTESAFYAFDRGMSYRYRAHGIPALALCGTPQEAVTAAPYGAALAMTVSSKKALSALYHAEASGMLGFYGFYDAYDRNAGPVRTYMAHHMGMLFAALCHVLTDRYAMRLFMRTPDMACAACLLGERLPMKPKLFFSAPLPTPAAPACAVLEKTRLLDRDRTPEECVLLGNGTFCVMLTASLYGSMKKGNIYLSRFRPRPVPQGLLCYAASGGQCTRMGETGKVFYHDGTVTWTGEAGGCPAEMTIVVPPDHNAQIRRIRFENPSDTEKTLRISLCLEPSLRPLAADMAHPAFGDLSLKTQESEGVLWAKRSAISDSEASAQAYLTVVGGESLHYFTDRLSFEGSMTDGIPDGARFPVADTKTLSEPYMACTVTITVAPHGKATLFCACGMPDRHNSVPALGEEAFLQYVDQAAHHSMLVDRLLGITKKAWHRFFDVLPFLVFSIGSTVAPLPNEGREGLYRFGLSGDHPYFLFCLEATTDHHVLEEMLLCYRLLQSFDFEAEMVILCDDPAGYASPLYENALSAIYRLVPEAPIGRPLGIYLIPAAEADEKAIHSVRLAASYVWKENEAMSVMPRTALPASLTLSCEPPSDLHLYNGYGGFDGGEYVVCQKPPIPWYHPLVNEKFGTWEGTDGTVFTWSENSRLFELTPWRGGRMQKEPTEYITIDGMRPVGGMFRFGGGYCIQEGSANGVYIKETIFVPPAVAGKYRIVELTNLTDVPKTWRLSFSVTPLLAEKEALAEGRVLCENGVFVNLFSGRCAYAPDREAVLSLAPHETGHAVFYLGTEPKPACDPLTLLAQTKDFWTNKIQTARIQTPDAALDTLFNERLYYQTIACRLMARCSPYQCGGAYGFRDRLQDTLSLLYTDTEDAKHHILECAAVLYEEGDAPHWWHTLTGEALRCIRSRCSDDRLWLIYTAARYVDITGDEAILSEQIGYLTSTPLAPHETERYEAPQKSTLLESLYQHLLRAADISLTHGAHGLPLIGTCDWNDGFNKIGVKGKGESVWLAFFTADVLQKLAALCVRRQDNERACRYRKAADDYLKAATQNGWDKEWYLRAFTDSGEPVGSYQNTVCRIDALVQAWSAIVTPDARSRHALQSVMTHLYDPSRHLLRLFAPAFSAPDKHIGYTASYNEGVRENGGQYTHAALWAAMGFGSLGDGNRLALLLHDLNPLCHTKTKSDTERYMAEPYAVAADVYAPTGRGGWSWYTGAAAWYRIVVLESLLGFQKKGDTVTFSPCFPDGWTCCQMEYRYKSTLYRFIIDAKGSSRPIRLEDVGGTVEITVKEG